MRSSSHVRRAGWHVGAAVVTVALTLSAGPLAAQTQKPTVQSDEQTIALKEFEKRLNGYVAMRAKLAKELKPLSPTPSASDLAARQESLAAALRLSRKMAKQGDLIPTSVASQLRNVVKADFAHRSLLLASGFGGSRASESAKQNVRYRTIHRAAHED